MFPKEHEHVGSPWGDLAICGLRGLHEVLHFFALKCSPSRFRDDRVQEVPQKVPIKLQSRARLRAARERESQMCKTYIFLVVLKAPGGPDSQKIRGS